MDYYFHVITKNPIKLYTVLFRSSFVVPSFYIPILIARSIGLFFRPLGDLESDTDQMEAIFGV